MPIDNAVIVHSTKHGNLRKPPRSAPQEGSRLPTQQPAFLQRTSKGRGGKMVTLITICTCPPDDQTHGTPSSRGARALHHSGG